MAARNTGSRKSSTTRKKSGKKTGGKGGPRGGSGGKGAGGREIEQYEHRDKQRANNPPVGLVKPENDPDEGKRTYAYDPHIDPALQFDSQASEVEHLLDSGLAAESLEEAKATLAELKRRREPYLNWAGKAEHTTFEVPTRSLHVHERIDPKTVIEAARKREEAREKGRAPEQASLFDQPEENPPFREAIDFYGHPHGWSNRLIAGDSLLVMNSLLEKEGMAGKVQMVYIDPPYGIRYGSNFQPFVNRRDVKDRSDEDLTQEPEMIRAFRDTWELGIHSYLTYLRDRLLLARELLHESGSCFVQIGDENIHHTREILDEVFSSRNFVCLIGIEKTAGQTSGTLPSVVDYLALYAKDKAQFKYRQLYRLRTLASLVGTQFRFAEVPGEERPLTLTPSMLLEDGQLPHGARIFCNAGLTSRSASDTTSFHVRVDGREFKPYSGGWRTTKEGMQRLEHAGRLRPVGNSLMFKRYLDDFPYTPLTNYWPDTKITGFTEARYFVVQTPSAAVARCILMATDPGDIVFDPTCGSGTTANVAEQWGRRWITCDTSRVAVTLTRQRLMTSVFDYYELAHPEEGVGSGFRYKTAPHVTLKSIANNPEIKEGMSREQIDAAIRKYAGQETLYDQPEVDRSKARVTGPFTVEAVPAPVVQPVGKAAEVAGPEAATEGAGADTSVARSGETLRQAEWREELLKSGIRGKSGQRILFSRVEPLSGTRWLHAEAETKPNDHGADRVAEEAPAWGRARRAVISFGPEHEPLEQRQVESAWREARELADRPALLVFAAFQFDPEAAKDIDELDPVRLGMQPLKVQMNPDLLTEDLKKKRASNESFWLIGQPDVGVRHVKEGEDRGRLQVEVRGFDYYNTKTGEVQSGDAGRIAVWMLDTDYDDRSLFPRQVFFPMAGPKEGWARVARSLRAEIDEERIEAYRGNTSLPFDAGPNRRIAVKVVDDRGIESLRVMDID